MDATLCSALIRAETWKRRLLKGEVASVEILAVEEQVKAQYISRVIRIAFLAPDLKRAILDGRQPPRLNVQAITTCDLPLAWGEQRRLFAA